MSGGTQYNVDLKVEPLIENSNYALWRLTQKQLQDVIDNESNLKWDVVREGREPMEGKFHPTATTRKGVPVPVRAMLRGLSSEETGKLRQDQRVLYHGMGRDQEGLSAISRGGLHPVVGYDPYHPNALIRGFPGGKFWEVWSIYTLNVVDKSTGVDILADIWSLMADNATVIIAVRRDNV